MNNSAAAFASSAPQDSVSSTGGRVSVAPHRLPAWGGREGVVPVATTRSAPPAPWAMAVRALARPAPLGPAELAEGAGLASAWLPGGPAEGPAGTVSGGGVRWGGCASPARWGSVAGRDEVTQRLAAIAWGRPCLPLGLRWLSRFPGPTLNLFVTLTQQKGLFGRLVFCQVGKLDHPRHLTAVEIKAGHAG